MDILYDNHIFSSQSDLSSYLEKLANWDRHRRAVDLIRALDQHRLLAKHGRDTWLDAYDVADKYDQYGKAGSHGD